jgi:uncharacterized cupredoxin-like copper-binding protein
MITLAFARPRLALAGVLLIAGSVLAACGDTASAPTTAPTAPTTAPAADATATPAAGAAAPAAGGEIAVTLKEWAIEPKAIQVAAGHQTFKVTNAGKFPHNFTVVVNGAEVKTPNIKAGESATLETDLAAGSYTSLCNIPGHKDRGMAGTVEVK